MSTESASRRVLVMESKKLFMDSSEYFNGFVAKNIFLGLPDVPEMVIRNGMLLDKAQAEVNTKFKQIIPYIVLACPEAGKFLVYRRSLDAGDERLRGKYSVGVGGHIEESDVQDSLEDTILACAYRELREEISLSNMPENDIYDQLNEVGYVNEDATPVGRVHFGVVFELYVPLLVAESGIQISDEESLSEHRWMTSKELSEIDKSEFELWSSLIVPFLTGIED